MTPEQIQLVHQTFTRIDEPNALAADFYRRLFEIEPSLRLLFKGDMEDQGQKLMTTLAMAVNGLKKFEILKPALEMLGRRHVAYGVKEEHYPMVEEALLEAIASHAGSSFTPQAREAWSAAYGLMADTMLTAANGVGVTS